MKTHSLLKNEAARLISSAFREVFPEHSVSDQIVDQVVYPDEVKLAHLAFPCHPLSKILRTAPVKISSALAAAVQKEIENTSPSASSTGNFIIRAEAVNGYLNFFCDPARLYEHLFSQLRSNQLYAGPLLPKAEQEKILVEYSQPNTHKALHVGHLRNMIYGEAICNLLAHLGNTVVRATFPGDLGTHIAKSLWYIEKYKLKEIPATQQAAWLGKIYAEADDFIKSQAGSADEAKIKAEVGEVLRGLEEQTGPHYELYRKTREWSLEQMRAAYQWLGIQFDVWYYESECDQPSRQLVQKKLKEGFFVESQGAVGLDLSADDLGFVLYLKSDGTGLYITKDLELFRRKIEDYHAERSIVVVDSRQKLHFRQLFKTAEKMGFPHADRSVHLAYESVTDENGKPCSSRSLTGVQLDELRGLIHGKVLSQYLESYRGEWPDAEIDETAEKISLGALKYGFLKVDANRIIRFILDDWIQLEGDTGPYLQYAFARCSSILEKLGQPSASPEVSLKQNIETELLLFLERFNEVALNSGLEYRPSILCTYLFDLAKLYNRFYKECPIKTAESPAVKDTRLGLVLLVSYALKKGLSLLGIEAPLRL